MASREAPRKITRADKLALASARNSRRKAGIIRGLNNTISQAPKSDYFDPSLDAGQRKHASVSNTDMQYINIIMEKSNLPYDKAKEYLGSLYKDEYARKPTDAETAASDAYYKSIESVSQPLNNSINPSVEEYNIDYSQANRLRNLMINKPLPSKARGTTSKIGETMRFGQETFAKPRVNMARAVFDSVKDNPKLAADTGLLGMVQSGVKLAGYGVEKTAGWLGHDDPTIQNRFSSNVLDSLKAYSTFYQDNPLARPFINTSPLGFAFGNISTGNAESLRSDFTSDTTGGDVFDFATNFIVGPGQAAKVAKPVIKLGVGATKVAGKTAARSAASVIKGAHKYPKTVAAGVSSVGAGAYILNEPDEAQAFSYSKFIKLLDKGDTAALNHYVRTQAKKITKRARYRRWEYLREQGVVPNTKMPTGVGWYTDPKYAGLGLDEIVKREDVMSQAMDFIRVYRDTPLGRKLERVSITGPKSGTLHWGHDEALASGGTLQEGGLIPSWVNLNQGTRSFRELIDDKIAEAAARGRNITPREAALELGILPAFDKGILRDMKRAGG